MYRALHTGENLSPAGPSSTGNLGAQETDVSNQYLYMLRLELRLEPQDGIVQLRENLYMSCM